MQLKYPVKLFDFIRKVQFINLYLTPVIAWLIQTVLESFGLRYNNSGLLLLLIVVITLALLYMCLFQ